MSDPLQPEPTSLPGGRFQQRLAIATGSTLVLYALPAAVSAAIVHHAGPSISLAAGAPPGLFDSLVVDAENPLNIVPFESFVTWDVDGDGQADFNLHKFGVAGKALDIDHGSTLYQAAYGTIALDSVSAQGAGFVQYYATSDAAALAPLNAGEMVGPTLRSSYAWGPPGQSGRSMLYFGSYASFPPPGSGGSAGGPSFSTQYAYVADLADYAGFVSDVPQYVGFRFTRGADTFYGWAALLLATEPGAAGVEILEWAYDDLPDTAIAVGATAVPIPAHGLAMLAAGAGGLLAMRRRRAHEARG